MPLRGYRENRCTRWKALRGIVRLAALPKMWPPADGKWWWLLAWSRGCLAVLAFQHLKPHKPHAYLTALEMLTGKSRRPIRPCPHSVTRNSDCIVKGVLGVAGLVR